MIKITALESLGLNPCPKCGEDCNLSNVLSRNQHDLIKEKPRHLRVMCGFCGKKSFTLFMIDQHVKNKSKNAKKNGRYEFLKNLAERRAKLEWNNQEKYIKPAYNSMLKRMMTVQ